MKQIRLFLTLMALMGLTATAVAENYGIEIGGTEVTSENYTSISSFDAVKSGTVTYDPATHTLTLSNAKISSDDKMGIRFSNAQISYNLVLADGTENTVTSGSGAALQTLASLTISGSGIATFTSDGDCGIYAHYTPDYDNILSIVNCTVAVSGRWGVAGYGVNSGTLHIINSSVTAAGTDGAISDFKAMSLLGSQVTSPSGASWKDENHAMCYASGSIVKGQTQVEIDPLPSETYAWLDGTTLKIYHDPLRYTRDGVTYSIPWEDDRGPDWTISDVASTITRVEINSFGVQGLFDASRMFQLMTNLQEITGLSCLSDCNITNMAYMFSNCKKLETIDLSSLNTSSVTSMASMFEACEKLKNLYISSFNTSNVTSMSYMFCDCQQLTSLSIASFNTSSVTNMKGMFAACTNLKTIYASELWSTANVTNANTEKMFQNCYYLTGGQGTTWRDTYPTDKTYARIDGGTSNPGYFTEPLIINETTFPDSRFRAWVLQQDYGQDGVLTSDEIASVTSINVNGKLIYDLNGIEYFTALTYLSCASNKLESLDVSQNRNLTTLHCSGNLLTALNVANNTALTTLTCFGNRLDVTAMGALVESLPTVASGKGTLSVMDYSDPEEGNNMTQAQADAAAAKNWTVTSYQGYFEVRMQINETTFPNEYFRTYLLQQSYGQDGILTASEIASVTSINVSNLQITDLTGIENFTALTSLNCSKNLLETIDLSKNTALTTLDCSQNMMEAIDLTNNTALITLDCSQNLLKHLDVTNNTKLTKLYCYCNILKPIHMKDLFELYLPTVASGVTAELRALDCDNDNEGNDLLNVDLKLATNKGWVVKNCVNGQWVTQSVTLVETDLMITKVRFPDDNFRSYLLQQTYGQDGVLTESEISKVKEIDVTRKDIADLKGIEVFTALEVLKCSQNNLARENVEYLVNALPYKWVNGPILITLTTAVAGIMQLVESSEFGGLVTGLLEGLGIENAPAYVYDKILDKYSLKLDIYDNTLQNEGNVITYEIQQTALDRGWVLREYDNSEKTWKTIDCCVEINEENFPDPNFRNWVLTQSYGQDGKLYSSEANKIYTIDVHSENIKSLKGIEHFTALEMLYCQRNQIEGDDMTDLVFNLPTDTKMQVIRDVLMQSEKYVKGSYDRNIYLISANNSDEGNVCDKTCVRIAKQRGWKVLSLNGTSWTEYAGSENGGSGMKGDMNNDNKVTIADAVLIVDEILNK